MILVVANVSYSMSPMAIRYSSLFESWHDEENLVVYFDNLGNILSDWSHLKLSNSRSSHLSKVLDKLMKYIFIPDRFIAHLYRYKQAFTTKVDLNRFDFMVIGCVPFSLLLLAPWIKKMNPKLRIIADLSDPFSFSNSASKYVLRKFIANRIEKKCFPCFSKVVVLNEEIQKKYQSKHPCLRDRFLTIEQGVDEKFINSIVNYKSRGDNESFTFLYAGAFYRHLRNPRYLYKAIGRLNGSCQLKVFGSGPRSTRPKSIENIHYQRLITRDRLIEQTINSDALVLMDNDFGYQVPGKTLEVLACGKPVLFIYNNDSSPTLKYVKSASGVVWARNNVEDIVSAAMKILEKFYSNPHFNYKEYTWESMRSKYLSLRGDS